MHVNALLYGKKRSHFGNNSKSIKWLLLWSTAFLLVISLSVIQAPQPQSVLKCKIHYYGFESLKEYMIITELNQKEQSWGIMLLLKRWLLQGIKSSLCWLSCCLKLESGAWIVKGNKLEANVVHNWPITCQLVGLFPHSGSTEPSEQTSVAAPHVML